MSPLIVSVILIEPWVCEFESCENKLGWEFLFIETYWALFDYHYEILSLSLSFFFPFWLFFFFIWIHSWCVRVEPELEILRLVFDSSSASMIIPELLLFPNSLNKRNTIYQSRQIGPNIEYSPYSKYNLLQWNVPLKELLDKI